MSCRKALIGVLSAAGFAIFSTGVLAESARETAIADGAKALTADQIAALIVGKTVTAATGDKRFLFHYSTDNVLAGKMIGGTWSDSGYYGITDDDRVCVSMSNDKGRLRCLSLLEKDGVVRKYNTAGKMTFELLGFENGKSF